MPTFAGVFPVVSLLVLIPTIASAAEGGTLHVPKEHPTIQGAIDAAHDGDTVLVAPGTYPGNLKVKGKSITLASTFLTSQDPRHIEQTILEGKSGKKRTSILTIDKSVGPGMRLIGFTIQNADHAVINAGNLETLHNHFRGNSDALSFESGRGAARFNIFEDDDDDGIDMDGASEVTIEDNIIRNNDDDGIEIRLHKLKGDTSLNIVIRRNMITGNREDGLQLIDYPGKSNRTFRIERNVFAGNAMAGIGCMPDGDTKEKFSGADLLEPVFIVNNTFIDNPYAITGGDNMVLLNNVIAGSKKVALKRIHGDSAAGVNLLWNNAADLDECDLRSDAFVEKDPRLDKNYKPMAGSPCIDAGEASLEYNGETLELPGDTFSGKAPDLGAFEHGK